MIRARKESALHLAFLGLVQWISLAVVILNATALYLLRSSKQSAFVNAYSSPADYMLLLLGSLSFTGSTVYLFLHFHLYFRLTEDQPFAPAKLMSAIEVIMAAILIALWTVSTSVILTHSQEPTSPCHFTSSLYTQHHSDICELFDTILILAYAAVGAWVLVLLATLFILIRSPIPPTTIFTIEAPPQRFSQPRVVSLPDEAYYRSDQPLPSRPYYMDYHNNNKVRPMSETHDASNNSYQRNKRKSMAIHHHHHHQTGPQASRSANRASRSRFIVEKAPLDDDGGELASSNMHNYYSTYYQPQHMPLSSPSITNSTATDNTASASYSSRCQLPQTESQRTLQSISTIESAHLGFAPIQFDLPIIRVGTLSHIDSSFLHRKYEGSRETIDSLL